VRVRASSRVIGQIPPRVVWIFVDHDGIAVPIPIIDVVVVIRRDAEIKIVEPEAIAISPAKAVLVLAPESTREAAMFPRMIDMIMSIAAARIMANPRVIVVDVRHLRMIRLIAV